MAAAAMAARARNAGVCPAIRAIKPPTTRIAPKMDSFRIRDRRFWSAATLNSYSSELGKVSGGSSEMGRSYSGSYEVGTRLALASPLVWAASERDGAPWPWLFPGRFLSRRGAGPGRPLAARVVTAGLEFAKASTSHHHRFTANRAGLVEERGLRSIARGSALRLLRVPALGVARTPNEWATAALAQHQLLSACRARLAGLGWRRSLLAVLDVCLLYTSPSPRD